MKQTYQIEGMTCKGCVVKVKSALENIERLEEVHVQLEYPQAIIRGDESIDLKVLQNAIGDYQISFPKVTPEINFPPTTLVTYKPLILIIGFILGISLLVQFPFEYFSWTIWMRHFMAGFFLVFAFFKLLNLEGFANSYRMYDIIAGKWIGWGYMYPFVELGLGVLYLINVFPLITNFGTLIILGISSIGVIRSVVNKRKIKCACLGDVFNLPMSTVTIIEDLTMLAMAGTMLILLLN